MRAIRNPHAVVLSILLSLVFVRALPAQEEADEIETRVVTKLEETPKRSHRQLKTPFEKLPQGHKAKIEIGRYFDHGQTNSTNKFEPYVSSFVPLNADGKEHGEQVVINPRGRVVRRVQWKDGRKHGAERIFHAVWPKYYEQARIPWDNGVIQGTKKTFFEDGTLKSETPYAKGLPHGISKSFSKKGTVTRKCSLKQGVRDGKLTDYWPQTGKKRREIMYDMGKVEGVTREYHPNGQLRRAVPFKNDLMHGEEKRFAEDGTSERSRYWIKGDLVTKTEFELKYKEK